MARLTDFHRQHGRIGHGERECPDEDLYEEGGNFGKELRSSPFKKGAGRHLSFQAPLQTVRGGLNFSGDQRERVTSLRAPPL
jgi:hypothetical protein